MLLILGCKPNLDQGDRLKISCVLLHYQGRLVILVSKSILTISKKALLWHKKPALTVRVLAHKHHTRTHAPPPAREGLLQTSEMTELLSFSLKTLIKTWKDKLIRAFSKPSVISELQSIYIELLHLVSDCKPLGQTLPPPVHCTDRHNPVWFLSLWLWIHTLPPVGRPKWHSASRHSNSDGNSQYSGSQLRHRCSWGERTWKRKTNSHATAKPPKSIHRGGFNMNGG